MALPVRSPEASIPTAWPERPGSPSRLGDPYLPVLFTVADRLQEAPDIWTLALQAEDGEGFAFKPGQFNMLTSFGQGEVPISISSLRSGDPLHHTVRDVGPVTRALCQAPIGSPIGVRGPFGTDWGVQDFADSDAVVVVGGIGLAPLRCAMQALLDGLGLPGGPRKVVLLFGGRTPDQLIFQSDLDAWAEQGAEVLTTVDMAANGWKGNVGVVTQLIPNAPFDPSRAMAIVCGPEVMMRFTIKALIERGLMAASIRLRISLERNMQCGAGLCGHCQVGPYILCQNGPVVTYDDASRLLAEAEL
ncbi:MAG TPA: FAD/NAD(P)-binding protein [Acidimicrobiales bacterium]|nr:FAD/NAD(P)-binding protein [Acidimicrobiales bacterium]